MNKFLLSAALGLFGFAPSAFAVEPAEAVTHFKLYEVKPNGKEVLLSSLSNSVKQAPYVSDGNTPGEVSTEGWNVVEDLSGFDDKDVTYTKDQSYIQSCTVEKDGDKTVRELTPGIVRSGLGVSSAYSLNGNVSYKVAYRDVVEINSFTKEDCTIQLPNSNFSAFAGALNKDNAEQEINFKQDKKNYKLNIQLK